MNTFAQRMGLKPGDVVIVPKSDLKIIRHYVVYEGVNYLGQECYLENQRFYGVRRITGDTFEWENKQYFNIRRFQGNDYQRNFAIQRAASLIGHRYDLLTFNCEHYANYVQYNRGYSNQSVSSVAATVLLLLCCI